MQKVPFIRKAEKRHALVWFTVGSTVKSSDSEVTLSVEGGKFSLTHPQIETLAYYSMNSDVLGFILTSEKVEDRIEYFLVNARTGEKDPSKSACSGCLIFEE
jgi:hypothetical protein